MIYIKFLREWNGHKIGSVTQLAAGMARELMRRKIAVATATPKVVQVERAVAPAPNETAAIVSDPIRRGPGRPRKVSE